MQALIAVFDTGARSYNQRGSSSVLSIDSHNECGTSALPFTSKPHNLAVHQLVLSHLQPILLRHRRDDSIHPQVLD